MDFKKMASNLKTRITPLVDKAATYWKKYSEKALDFTAKQASATPLFLRTEEEFNIHASAKRSILIAYDETDDEVKNLLLLLPLWGWKAWMDKAELRYISLRENADLAKTIKIKWPIEMRIGYDGNDCFKTNKLSEIKEWWTNRYYVKPEIEKKKAPKKEEVEEAVDPLAGK